MEIILSFLNLISGGNQAILGAISLAVSGSVVFMLKAVPAKIINFVKTNLIVSVTLNNGGWKDEETFMEITKIIKTEFKSILSRSYSVRTEEVWDETSKLYVKDTHLVLGYGLHIFYYKGKFVWITLSKLPSQAGAHKVQEEIIISCFGKDSSFFDGVISKVKDTYRSILKENKLKVFNWSGKEWDLSFSQAQIGIDSLALNQETRTLLCDTVGNFVNQQELYTKLNLSYKINVILHGKPGTGKTSIIRAVASTYNMDIYNINLAGMSDQSFQRAVCSVPKNSIILLEDFDSCSAMKDRKVSNEVSEDMSFLTLSGILNTLDGVVRLDGNVIFMTTNHLDKIDPAVYRPGRTDLILELPEINKETVKEYFETLYPELTKIDLEYKAMSGCTINKVVFESKDDYNKVVKYFKEG